MRVFDICEFGARTGTDSTAAIRAALEEAGRVGGTVLIPGGRYETGMLKIPANIHVEGVNAWSVDSDLGSALVFTGEGDCLLDLSAANGTTVNALVLDGAGKKADGIKAIGESGKTLSVFLETLKIHDFDGCGIRFCDVKEGSVRHSLLLRNRDCGASLCGTDLTFTDSRALSCGTGLALCGGARISVTSSEFSNCEKDGIRMDPVDAVQLLSDVMADNGAHGLAMLGTPERLLRAATVSACRFSGNREEHATLDYVFGSTFCANLFASSETRPLHALGLSHLWDVVVRVNLLSESSRMESIRDEDNHRGKTIISANVG